MGGDLSKILDYFTIAHLFAQFQDHPLWKKKYKRLIDKVTEIMFIASHDVSAKPK